jgi:hypothetical protein
MRNRRADRSDGVVIRLPGVAASNATFARSSRGQPVPKIDQSLR